MLQKLLRLSDEGYKNTKRAIGACVASNLIMLIPFMVIVQVMMALLSPLITGAPLDVQKLWILFAVGVGTAVAYFFVYRNEYDKTYTAAYGECEKIRVEVAERMRKLPLSFFNRKDLSELTTNIMGDCSSIEHTMSHVVPSMIANIITIIIACAMLAIYDWRMALAVFVMLPACFGIIAASRKIQEKYGERHVQAKLDVSGQVQEYLDGIKVVKAFGLSGEKSKALDGALKTMMKEAIRFEAIAGAFSVAAQMLLRVGTGLVVLAGAYLLTDGSLDVIVFLTFLLVSVKIYAPITALFTMLPEFFYMLTSTKRMQILRQEPVMDGNRDVELDDCNIELDAVSFAYNKDEVISDMTITLPQNEVTALVGPSGSGKSTLSRLVARFWDVNKGKIKIGGKDISEVEPEQLMKYMSFVFQDVVLFNDTVRNNIAIGKEGATDGEIRHAAQMARCGDFIDKLPQGYDTVIGENGCTISGGERQRISIARALLKDAPIVLLDEATASLDPENEVLIQEAIGELVKGRTVLVIAHRLRTVAGADNIIVLEDGRVAEQGTGEELLAQDGIFAKLYGIQQQSLGWSVK